MKTMDDCGRKYHPDKKDIKQKKNKKRAPGELTPLRLGHPFNLNGVTTRFSIKPNSIFEGIKDSIVVVVVIDLVLDSVVV